MAQPISVHFGEPKSTLLAQMCQIMRLQHLSYCTEEAYVSWVKRFIVFHEKPPPKDMGTPEIRAFLLRGAV